MADSTRFLNMACRGCGERSVELFLDLGDQPHCNRLIAPAFADRREPFFPLRAGFCHRCTLVQIDHTIPKEDMFRDYPYVSGTTKTLVAHFRDSARRLVERYDLDADDLVVDIGSNDGTWLEQYAPFGLRRVGVEPAENVAAIATNKQIPTLTRFFNLDTATVIEQEHGKASLITAAGVFFHLEELHSVIDGIAALLGEGGVFVVQAIYLGGMIENTAFDQIYHEHLCYYTLRSLEALFAKHGLAVFDVDVVPVHGGSLEAHVGRPGEHQIQPSVLQMRDREERLEYGKFETYLAFAGRVRELNIELKAVLEEFRSQGKRIQTYGAPAKGATLLNSFGIDTDLVEAAAEKNPMKFGKMVPGVRIPIVDEAVVERPDAYLVLAWNFLDEFIEKEKSFLEAGGTFIVPVPEVTVVTKDGQRPARMP